MSLTNTSQLVTLCDVQDRLKGYTDIISAHTSNGQCHRAISVFIFRLNPKNKVELLIQKRSAKKITSPLKWANTVCANVWQGENRRSCVRRRLKEEIGVTEKLMLNPIIKFYYQIPLDKKYFENEVDVIYSVFAQPEIKINIDEVCETKWVEWELLLADVTKIELGDFSSEYAQWFIYMLKNNKIVKAINQYIAKNA